MRNAIRFSLVAFLALGAVAPAEAGCLKGAAIGAVAGHIAGHHAVLGAVAGCATEHYLAVKKRRQEELQKKQQHETATSQGTHPVAQTQHSAP
jgi:hypothetical protein